MIKYGNPNSQAGTLQATHEQTRGRESGCHASCTTDQNPSISEPIQTDLPHIVAKAVATVVDLLISIVTNAKISAYYAKCNTHCLQNTTLSSSVY